MENTGIIYILSNAAMRKLWKQMTDANDKLHLHSLPLTTGQRPLRIPNTELFPLPFKKRIRGIYKNVWPLGSQNPKPYTTRKKGIREDICPRKVLAKSSRSPREVLANGTYYKLSLGHQTQQFSRYHLLEQKPDMAVQKIRQNNN